MAITAKDIDDLLPQTQCKECGFDGCYPYAEAIQASAASIDKCPPGGAKTLKALAGLFMIDPKPYMANVEANTREPSFAHIRESECIGCTKCIQACPVDAIVGASKLMHVVITNDCTGCGLCVDPCPVDCIDMLPTVELTFNKDRAREQYQAKKRRKLRDIHEQQQAYRMKKHGLMAEGVAQESLMNKRAYILEALDRKNKNKT